MLLKSCYCYASPGIGRVVVAVVCPVRTSALDADLLQGIFVVDNGIIAH